MLRNRQEAFILVRKVISDSQAVLETTNYDGSGTFLKKEERIEMRCGNGFNYEAEHFGNLIKEERKNRTLCLWQKSLSIAKTMDQIREHCEVRYPFEM